MSKLKQLQSNYTRHILDVPWREDASPEERIVFCVYNEKEEQRLRFVVDDFELATRNKGKGWVLFDLTDTFAQWLSGQKYAKRYFQQPELIPTLLPKYLGYIEERFGAFLCENTVDANTIVALKGVGSLFGFLKVKEVVDVLAPRVKGRLLVFFPGSYENNNYRLLDGYDGWSYLAIPLTAEMSF